MGTLDEVKGLVENPPKEYRSAPFWGWNDRLQRENLGEQIEGFKRAGYIWMSCLAGIIC